MASAQAAGNPPSTPVPVASVTQTSISVTWAPSTDDTGALGYVVRLDGGAPNPARSTAFTFSELACDTTHVVSVQAFDLQLNGSGAGTVTATTSACSSPAPPPPPPPPLGNAKLESFTIQPNVVSGNSSVTGTVTLTAPASGAGATVSFWSPNKRVVSFPPKVTVPAGVTSASFIINPYEVIAPTEATILADIGGRLKSASVTVHPGTQTSLAVTGLSVRPAQLQSGTAGQGTVTLSGAAPNDGVKVSLASSSAAVTVPSFVRVAKGSATASFTVTAGMVGTQTSATIAARLNGSSRTYPVTVVPVPTPPPVSVASVGLNPTTVTAGASSQGTVNLSAAAPAGGLQVTLSSSNAAAAVPFSVSVAAGSSSAPFMVSTSTVTVVTNASIGASANGSSASRALTINPAPAPAPALVLSSISLSAASLVGGNPAQGTVTLSGAAPAGGVTVLLSSSNRAVASVPASIAVPAGARSASFAVETSAVTSSTSVVVSAAWGGLTKTAILTLTPVSAGTTGTGVHVYVAPNGSDATCMRDTPSRPCASFDKAYRLANLGETVEVAGGTYPAQNISAPPKNGPVGTCSGWTNIFLNCIVFRPASGATVSMPGAGIESAFVELNDLNLTGSTYLDGLAIQPGNSNTCPNTVHDNVARNIRAAVFFVGGSDHVSILGGSFGPFNDDASKVNDCGGTIPVQHLLIDGITIHDYHQKTAGVHMECIHFQQASIAIIRNSKFLNCAQNDLSIQTHDSLGISNLTVENNFFDEVNSHPAAGDINSPIAEVPIICNGDGEDISNVTIRFNSLYGGFSPQVQGGCRMTNVKAYANVAQNPSAYSCGSPQYAGSVTWTYNVWKGGAGGECGSSNAAVGDWPYLNPDGYDFHLPSGARPIDFVPISAGCPAADLEGTGRPIGAGCDAGAHERSGP